MRFLIISRQRAGSHMLSSMLDSHPDLTCFGEAENVAWLDRLHEGQGAMIKYNRVEDREKLGQFRLIHLVRKDLLELTISNYLLKCTTKLGSSVPFHKVHTDSDDLLIWGETMEGDACWDKDFTPAVLQEDRTKNRYRYTTDKQTGFPIDLLSAGSLGKVMGRLCEEVLSWHDFLKDRALTVFYEDIVGSSRETTTMPEDISRRICRHLGVPQHTMTTSFKKVNKFDRHSLPKKVRHLKSQLRDMYVNTLLT